MNTKTLFSKQAKQYALYRPTYPSELFEFIISLTAGQETLWDCGTGSGQAAKDLAPYFKKVYATDISREQLENAFPAENIEYINCPAEKTPFPDNQFDLITTAQAVHWFDFEKFFNEARRVGKPGSVIAFWGYWLPSITDEIDKILFRFYSETLKEYWHERRSHIDELFETVPFDFEDAQAKVFRSTLKWSYETMEGFLNSWSAVQKFKDRHQINPVDDVMKEIHSAWPEEDQKTVTFPIFLKAGKINK